MDSIPEEQTGGFPLGISEENFDTDAEMDAFFVGLDYADDIDVEHGKPFTRSGIRIVRIRVGTFDE